MLELVTPALYILHPTLRKFSIKKWKQYLQYQIWGFNGGEDSYCNLPGYYNVK